MTIIKFYLDVSQDKDPELVRQEIVKLLNAAHKKEPNVIHQVEFYIDDDEKLWKLSGQVSNKNIG